MAEENQNSQQSTETAPEAENQTNDEQTNEENQETETENSSNIDEELQTEKAKELELLKQRNAQLEQQLKGKSRYLPPENKDEKTTKECNNFLKSTGMKI